MIRILSFVLLSFFLNLIPASAKNYKVEEIPMVHLQDRTRYVSNPDNILSTRTVETIDKMFFDLEQATGIQVMVIAVTGIDGGDCFEFAYQLGQQQGVGEKKRDNGLVVLLSTDERCIQFVTGYGLEGILPDAICKRIQSRYMLQHFKNNDWDKGMLAGMKAIQGILNGSMDKIEEDDSEDTLAFIIFFGIVGGIIILAIYGTFMNGRCPKCKKRDVLQRISSKVISRKDGIITSEVIYLCSNCGKKVVKIEKTTDHNYRGPRNHNRRIFIGGGGFGSSGGGFSGGSFGGGSFGGGGAGSRF